MSGGAHREQVFESEIAEYLNARGWLYSPDGTGYDKELALFPEDVLGWLADTQPDQLAKVVRDSDPEAKRAKDTDRLLAALVKALDAPLDAGGGTLNVLRKGFRHISAQFQMAQARPSETMNPTTQERYGKNRLRVMRQVHYSKSRPNRSIDLVLFLNGLPVATIELKTDFTQSVVDGQVQYAHSRQPSDPGKEAKEPLLSFGARAVVFFVVTNTVVAMTTRLDGKKTTFLPFNRGYRDGAGNPPDPDGSDTSYFWRDVLQRDMWLTILLKYMLVKKDENIDPATGQVRKSTSIRFPRYHQLGAVEKIVGDAYEHGPGQRYLIEHSAGSGKTDTIVWTAYRLAALHDKDNRKVFDSVVVVTDRNVLDAQMSRAMLQLDHKQSQVVAISGEGESKSAEFAAALAARTPIIIVTIQTAPFAFDHVRQIAQQHGGTFAVIADEAHSSQTGNAAAKLRQVLSPAELSDLDDGGEVDAEDLLAAELHQRATAPNISYLAFTATPKAKTMELFGRPGPDGVPASFHRYSMRQAIQEGFILDVLTNYTPYRTAFRLAMDGQEYDSETIDRSRAMKSVMRWVRLHPANIAQKVAIIVEHFRDNISHLLDGNAKAMVVTGSRKEAVRYHKALNAYIEQHGYTNLHALVAFSGTVDDPESHPDPVTEVSLNPGLHGKPIASAFNGPDYKVLIVANKFQVGFDQPLLTAMYVDKRLAGVMAVQTLSRLNRTYKGKDKVYVLDFVNDPAEILEAFQPYYVGAELSEVTDPNIVHALATKLDASGLYDLDDVEKAAQAAITSGSNDQLAHAVSPTWHRYVDAQNTAVTHGDRDELDRLEQFRSDLVSYVKAYDFLSQIVDYDDTQLEKRAIFYRALGQMLTVNPDVVTVDLSTIVMTHLRTDTTGDVTVNLETGEATPLTPLAAVGTGQLREDDKVHWTEVLDAINTLFSDTDLSEEDRIANLETTLRKTKQDPDLVNPARHNTDEDFYADPSVVEKFLRAVIASHEASAEYTDAMLKGQNKASLVYFLRTIGFRDYLASATARLPH